MAHSYPLKNPSIEHGWPDATEIASRIADGRTTAEAVIREHLDRAGKEHPRINAAVELLREEALAEARSPRPGPLSGVPVSIKETLGIAGRPITAGSIRMPPIHPDVDSEIVRRVRASGAIPIARTNIPELAMSHETDNIRWGRTNNPLDPSRTCGGSSGGEAAFVGSGCSALGFGSDIGGSVRWPAHCCGVVGFKPASGAIDKRGTFPEVPGYTGSMLALGPIARSVRDVRLAHGLIADSPLPSPRSAEGLRLLVANPFRTKIMDPCVGRSLERARKVLGETGMKVENFPVPEADEVFRTWIALIVHEHAGAMKKMLASPEMGRFSIPRELWRQLTGRPTVWGKTFWTLALMPLARPFSPKAERAIAFTERMREKIRGALGRDGVLLLPLAGMVAPRHTVAASIDNRPGLQRVFTPTIFTNSLDLPAITVPSWPDADPLPPGIQLASAPGAEGTLLDVAAALEAGLSEE